MVECFLLSIIGEVSERFKELVLKTSDFERGRGFESHPLRQYCWRNGRVAEGACLLSKYTTQVVSRVRIPLSPPYFVLLAQLDRALDYESRGRGFESLKAHHLNPRAILALRVFLIHFCFN